MRAKANNCSISHRTSTIDLRLFCEIQAITCLPSLRESYSQLGESSERQGKSFHKTASERREEAGHSSGVERRDVSEKREEGPVSERKDDTSEGEISSDESNDVDFNPN